MMTIICVVSNTTADHHLAPLAVGFALVGLIYGGGHVSKAHYNPAVTLAFFLTGKLKPSAIPGYLIAQILGAILAALIGGFLFNSNEIVAIDLRADGIAPSLWKGMIAEFLGTFIIVWVILQVALAKTTRGNEFYGIAIGFAVAGAAYAFGSFGTYACFNPAVALGTWVTGLNTPFNFCFIIIANFLAGIVAVQAFKWTAEVDQE